MVIRWAVTIVNNLLLSLIAFSRFILLKNPNVGKMIFSGKAAQIPLSGTWVVGITVVMANVFWVSHIINTCAVVIRIHDLII